MESLIQTEPLKMDTSTNSISGWKKDGMIPGFIEGLEKLSFGDKAILFIPPHLAYGAGGAGDVIPIQILF
jgi:FKBP-type peptidyl-prolyl cis-trans isomerase